MDYVEGLPLNEYCDRNNLATGERLKLFRTVCSAVHYAHQNLVIHRDLKPGNILVTSDGTPKLLDFGIAKVFHSESSVQAEAATVTQFRVMTPEYASPEQVRGEMITTASDVYSLGVILYQLLTGHRPYRLETRSQEEIARAICDDEPERPSDAIADRGLQIPDPRFEIRNPKLLRGDLDNIVLMAMRKERQRRYSSVEQLSDDIRRHLEGLPVIARKDTFGYRVGKFVRRNKAGVTAATLLVLTLIAGIVATAWQARRAGQQSRIATQQRDNARLEQTKAERINAFLQQMLSYANPSWYAPGKGKKRDLTVLEALDEASRRIENEMADEPEIKAQIHTTIGDTYGAIGRNDLAEPHFEAALTIRELFGNRGVKLAESLYYLGGIKFLTGDWVNSERLYQEALSIQREMPNEGNNLPYMLLDLGNLLTEKGDTTSAEALFREALDIFRNRYGEEHITVAIAHGYLGFAFNTRGDLNAAQAEYEEAMRLYQKAPDNNLAQTKIRLGQIHTAKAEYKEAESCLRESLSLLLQQYGDKSERPNDARLSLAHLFYHKADYRAAKREVEEVLQLDLKYLSEERAEFASAWTLLGMILNKTGKQARAETYLRDALSLYSRAKPRAARGIAGIKGALGECLMDQKRYEEAESFLSESYDSVKVGQVSQSPTLREAMNRLATLYERWGKPGVAAQFRVQPAEPK